jgi:hypothetical protein
VPAPARVARRGERAVLAELDAGRAPEVQVAPAPADELVAARGEAVELGGIGGGSGS